MYIIFRLIPALAGSVLTPLCYLVLQELGFGVATGALAGFMILFGNIGFKYILHFLQSKICRDNQTIITVNNFRILFLARFHLR